MDSKLKKNKPKNTQKLINYIAPLLMRVRYLRKPDPFKLFYKIISGEEKIILKNEPKTNQNTLLIAPVRVSPMSNLFEGIIGYFFKIRGWHVQALMCDQSVYYCDNITHADEKRRLAICSLCKSEQDRFCEVFKFEKISIKNLVGKEKRAELDKFSMSVSTLKNLEFENIKISSAVESAVNRYTLKSQPDWKREGEIIQGYINTSITTIAAIKKHTSISRVDKVIISHGIYSQWGALASFFESISLDMYVWARGYVGQGNLIFGKGTSYLKYFINEKKEVYQNIYYSKDKLNKAALYFDSKINPSSRVDYLNYYKNLPISDGSDINELTKKLKSKYKKIFGMFTNIPWDGQIYNKTDGFPNTRSYLDSVITWFKKNNDVVLVIRAHPAEADREEGRGSEKIKDILYEISPNGLPSNIVFLEPSNRISSYDVINNIDAAIIYGSTLGLEICRKAIPVIQAGHFYTSGKEIVFEAMDQDELYRYLSMVKNGTLVMSKAQIENANKFGYYWIFIRHIEDDTVTLNRLEFNKFNFENLSEFTNSKTLNHLYNKITEGSDIFNYSELID